MAGAFFAALFAGAALAGAFFAALFAGCSGAAGLVAAAGGTDAFGDPDRFGVAAPDTVDAARPTAAPAAASPLASALAESFSTCWVSAATVSPSAPTSAETLPRSSLRMADSTSAWIIATICCRLASAADNRSSAILLACLATFLPDEGALAASVSTSATASAAFARVSSPKPEAISTKPWIDVLAMTLLEDLER